MAKNETEAPEAAEYEALPVDVCGQPGGPSAEEQARVDQEQRDFMERRDAEQAAKNKAERENHEAKLERNRERAQKKRDEEAEMKATIDQLVKDVADLKAKAGI